MTEKELRQRVAARAESLLGLREADGSYLTLIEAYNAIRPLPRGYRMLPTDPWCAAFVSALGALEGLSGVLLPECGCAPMIALYEQRGRWERGDSGRAGPGDLIFYDWSGNGIAEHVGLVTAADAAGYEVVEGNCSDAVSRRRVARHWRCIAGFAFPDYASAADGKAEEAGETEVPAESAWTLPLLRRGMTGKSVLAMQGVLIARGCGCGPDGADGDFGANTESALRAFQRGNGLPDDGVCGDASWKKLLGVSA